MNDLELTISYTANARGFNACILEFPSVRAVIGAKDRESARDTILANFRHHLESMRDSLKYTDGRLLGNLHESITLTVDE